jgi:general secretion pathway protein M
MSRVITNDPGAAEAAPLTEAGPASDVREAEDGLRVDAGQAVALEAAEQIHDEQVYDEPRRGRRPDWRCVAAWLGTLLIPALLVAAVALPLVERARVLDEDYDRGLDQLQRYQGLLATLPRLRSELAQEQANDDFKAFYFDAETPGLAGATLQSEVQDMVRAAGGRPISTQILPVDESEQPTRVRIRTQLQGTTDELLDVLYRIEASRPFLFVDQMSIRSTTPRRRNVRSRRGRQSAAQQNVGQLTVRLDIFGYVLGSGK